MLVFRVCNIVGGSTGVYSGFLVHSTSIANGLQILRNGAIQPGPGICGIGIYCFEAKFDSVDEALSEPAKLKTAYLWGATNGYNRGCAFLLRTRGLHAINLKLLQYHPEVREDWFARFYRNY